MPSALLFYVTELANLWPSNAINIRTKGLQNFVHIFWCKQFRTFLSHFHEKGFAFSHGFYRIFYCKLCRRVI